MDFLLSGSLAYDTILIHEGFFHHKIMPEQIARLNVAFGIDSAREEFGGTAGNIAYNSALLNIKPVLVSSVGKNNCQRYLNHLKNIEVDTKYLNIVSDEIVANAWILTDQSNNQITGFHLGAMKYTPKVPQQTPELWHLAPDTASTTLSFAKLAKEQGKKYFLDPGQALPSLIKHTEDTEEMLSFRNAIKNATGLFVNEYESLLLQEELKLKTDDLFKESKLEFVIVTKGSEGSLLLTPNSEVKFPVAKANNIIDPTGCGDAFRAGFISQYIKNQSLLECVAMGSVMGAFAIETSGGQNHNPELEDIYTRFHELSEYLKDKRKLALK